MKLDLSRKQKIGLGVFVLAPALYAVAGFWLAPSIALPIANKELANYFTAPAHIEKIKFNPFTFELDLLGFDAGDALKFEQLHANLQLDSAWSGALHLKQVRLTNANVALTLEKNGDINLVKLLKLPATEPAEKKPESAVLFPVRIDQIAIISSKFHFQDKHPAQVVKTEFDIASAELNNFSTVAGEVGELTLQVSEPAAGKMEATGKLSIAPLSASGTFKLSDGKLAPLWPYVAEIIPVHLEQGQFSLSSQFKVSQAKTLEVALHDTKLKLGPLALQSEDKQPLLKLAKLSLSKIQFDLAKQQVQIGKIRSQGLEAWASREADGELNWQKLVAGKTATDETQAANNASPKWQVVLADTQLKDYRLHLTDKAASEPVNLEIGPLNLQASEYNSTTPKPIQIAFDTGIAGQGKLAATGQVNLEPLNANLKLTSTDLDLRLAQAYITPFLYLKINSGALNSDLSLDLRNTSPLDFSVSGKLDVNELQTLDTLKNRDLLKWQQLHLDGLNYQHGNSLSIDKVTLNEPYARFIIAEDRTTNVSDLLKAQAAPATATTATDTEKNKPTEKAAPIANNAAKPSPLAIKIGQVSITDGSAYFSDQSLTPNFKTAVQQLNGQLANLDSTKPQATPIEFKGRVDRYAPLEINGTANLFDPLNQLDVTAKFRHIELTTLSPYSGKFAGYRIRKGKLNLDLHYLVEKRELKAQNNVVLEQLQLGEKVDSPDAVDLPIKLALALMKDSEGKITVDVPIQGNLDSPQFEVGPAIWQTVRNLVLKVVKSPFNALANLMGGDNGKDQPDLSKVPFNAGSDQLDPKSQQALASLANALHERPTLRLDVEGISHKTQDAPQVAQQQLELAYQKGYYLALQKRGEKVPATPDLLAVPAEQKPVLIESIYQSTLKQAPPADWKALDKTAKEKKMAEALLANWQDNESLLRKLAQKRAATIKDYLVQTGKLSEDRIYLLDVNVLDAPTNKPIQAVLHLDSD